MNKQETTFVVIIGTPNNDGFGWSHVKHDMTMDEYLETRLNISGSICTIRGPIEWAIEDERKIRAKKSKQRK